MKLLYFFVALFSLNAYAIESIKTRIITTDKALMHKTNNTNAENAKKSADDLSAKITNYKKCTDKNMVYVGPDAPVSVDSDNCFDVITAMQNSSGSLHPTYAGALGGSNKTYIYHTAGLQDSSILGRFNADIQCNAQYPNSHAMVYEDVKYILTSLTSPANINNAEAIVFDAVANYASNGEYLTKYGGIATNLTQCENFSGTNDSSAKMVVLKKESVSSNNILSFDITNCSNARHIICVYN